MNVMPTSCWMRLSSTCICLRSLRSSAPSGSSRRRTAGRYEQLGDPEELYERPQTRFVAGFLGVSNLLTGHRLGDEGTHGMVRVVGDCTVRVPRERLNGKSNVEIGVRPEKIRLVERDQTVAERLNRVEGTVIDASYIGVSTQYIVRVADSADITVYEQNVERTEHGSLYRPGDAGAMIWSPEHTFVVKEPAVDAAAAP